MPGAVTLPQLSGGWRVALCNRCLPQAPQEQHQGAGYCLQLTRLKMNATRLGGNVNLRADVASTFVIVDSQSKDPLKGQ